MVKISIRYEGNLRCRLTHGPSGDQIVTDAPVDNMGKGEAFSPTDLAAGALGSCMLTVMGIAADKHHIDINGTAVEVDKQMIADPDRRIAKIGIVFQMPSGIDPSKRPILEQAARNCPVNKSLGSNVLTPVEFRYPD